MANDLSANDTSLISRRRALKCMALGAGTVFAISGGVLSAIDLTRAAETGTAPALGKPLFVQISDTHIGFKKDANPDVIATLNRSIDLVNTLPKIPRLLLHTGDITHLSKPEEFDLAQELLRRLHTSEMHTTPGEHDVADTNVSEYFDRFGAASRRKGYYSFDHEGVHFIALVNVLQAKDGGGGSLGDEQIKWALADLKGRSSSTPLVIFAHMPLWPVYEAWGWNTSDAAQVTAALRRFGSVSVLNGHIHQIAQKVEGNISFHTARSTAYPQPAPGTAAGPGPLKVPAEQLAQMLGITSVTLHGHPRLLAMQDEVLA
jgi:3',5'-cyclic AMP phosphodiesterase CpdA